MTKNRKFLIGGVIIALAIAYLAYSGFQASASYYFTVGEAAARGSALYGENLKINGRVGPGTVSSDIQTLTLKFTLVEGDKSMPVVYQGVTPDNFRPDTDIVVEGRFDPSGVFHASSIITKCPSKYVPRE